MPNLDKPRQTQTNTSIKKVSDAQKNMFSARTTYTTFYANLRNRLFIRKVSAFNDFLDDCIDTRTKIIKKYLTFGRKLEEYIKADEVSAYYDDAAAEITYIHNNITSDKRLIILVYKTKWLKLLRRQNKIQNYFTNWNGPDYVVDFRHIQNFERIKRRCITLLNMCFKTVQLNYAIYDLHMKDKVGPISYVLF